MGKNQSASNLPNIIQYSNGSINFVSGSTLLMQISSSGAITTTGVISGSNALSSSYAVNSDQLDGFDSTAFVFTSSFNTYSSSMSTRVSNLESTGSTLTTASASFAVVSSSYSTASGSLSTRVTKIEGNYATTGSNIFLGAQTVCANITSTGTIIAQTLNVQQVTSSVVYSSGSNIFGCSTSDVQQMTGSVRITGSLSTVGIACFSNMTCTLGGLTAGCGDLIVDPIGKCVTVGRISATSGDNSTFVVRDRTDALRAVIPGGGSINTIFRTNASCFIVQNYSGTDMFRIANDGTGYFSGNVGIGEAARTTSTLVINNTNAKNELTFGGSEYTNIYSETTSGMQFGIVSSGNSAAIEFFTNNAERMRITSCGNVTICTIDNQGGLTVTSAQDNTTVRVGTTATGGQEWRIQSTGGTSGLGQGKLFFKVGTTEAGCNIPLVLTTDNGANGARVGIGTTSPQDKLYVIGADNGITICSATANRPVLSLVNGSTTMLKLSANGTYGAIASCTGDLMYFYGDKIGVGITTPSFAFEVNSSNNTAITSNNTFGANLNIIFNRDNTGSTRNCFNILADQNSAYLRTLDNYPITFVTNGQNRTVISNTGIACFACQVCAPNFKFTQYGSIQSFVGSVAASGTKTITICTDGGGVLNGALQVTVGLFVNGAGGNSVVSWIVGGYMGAGAMRIVEVARSSDTYGCIGVMTNPANCLIFTVGNCFAFNGMDYSVMVTSVNANTSALKIY